MRSIMRLLGAAALVGLITPGQGFADESSTAADAEGAALPPVGDATRPEGRIKGIEEIVITARKREETLQDTPISVTAFSEADILDAGIGRADDIGRFTPNLQFDQNAGEQGSARLQIRGVGTGDPIATRDPGVGIYIDGVYLARAQGSLLGVVDIARVEVLRGPQGTLFGRNTIGGAVNIVTQKPTDTFESNARLRVGNFDLFESRAMINIPLVPESAALRLSVQTTTRDGYTKNRLNGQRTDDRKNLAVRAALRLNPSDDVEIMLTGEQSRAHQAGRGAECRFTPENLAIAPLIVGLESTGGLFTPAANCMMNEADDELRFQSPVRSKDNLDTYGLGANVTWDLDGMTFKSLSSWRRQVTELNEDFTFSSQSIGNVITESSEFDQVSQEFNLSGAGMDGRLQWTTGLYGFYEKSTPGFRQQLVGFDFCNLVTLGADLATLNLQAMPDDPAAQLDAAVANGTAAAVCSGSSLQRLPDITTLALAGYGQATYDVFESLHVTIGLRYSGERKEFGGSQSDFVRGNGLLGPAATVGSFNGSANLDDRSERFGKWTPLFNVSYDVAEEAMVYATYSRGFKSGGFNGRPNGGVPASLLPFEQETLDNYEVGMKARWLDNRLETNIAMFYGIYDDIQQTILSAGDQGQFASRVANAGEAVVRGAEVELRAVPAEGLDLRLGLGFTDAEYREFMDQLEIPGTMGMSMPVNRRSEEFPNTPSFSATISAGYTLFDVGPLGDVSARLNWYHQDEVNYGQASDTLEQGKYGLLSGQLLFALPDGKTEIALFGENLLDRRYVNSGINFERGFALSLAYFGAPRMYGLEVRRSF
jgi:iron complex outermembrane receptor protein